MMAEEARFTQRDFEWSAKPSADKLTDFRVLIIGAGISGILAAIKLRDLHIPHVVLEKNAAVGEPGRSPTPQMSSSVPSASSIARRFPISRVSGISAGRCFTRLCGKTPGSQLSCSSSSAARTLPGSFCGTS